MSERVTNPPTPQGAHAILVVDDEPQACKWFARLYGDEFVVLTAGSVNEALAVLAQRGHEVAVLLTDFSMPERNGVALLSETRAAYPHVYRLLVSAYADKDVALSAVNQGQVEKILEKPLDEALTRQTLRHALTASRERARDQALLARRAATLRETLGFLAHEVTSPLATVSGYLSAMKNLQEQAGSTSDQSLLAMINAAQRRTDYAQSLVSTFVQSARDASRGDTPSRLFASDLVRAVRDEYPFEPSEGDWLACDLMADFEVPGRRDLLFLVLCTLIKNALLALRSAPPAEPLVWMRLLRVAPAPGLGEQPAIEVVDNGPGIPAHILPRLTREPVTTRADSGGSGMGLLFCQRVMSSLGGSVSVASAPGEGTTITLHFPFTEPHKATVST
ncbi:hybrid sensor histidine kinase/response regulator [Hydrogenophaga sp.]|uniref:hybrid sensor histidine kinase/response regulator n=1 Tax=Hydrogenophaga sp. TaxID=1904254 RepID=UPI0025BD8F39|nr:hybrid sensor histidine kinase/response regulator [Hydrogenophaga sp.]